MGIHCASPKNGHQQCHQALKALRWRPLISRSAHQWLVWLLMLLPRLMAPVLQYLVQALRPSQSRKLRVSQNPKKRKLGNEVSTDISEDLIQLEKTVEVYRNECAELVAKIDSMEIKAIDQEADYLRKIAKKDEQIKTQDELMTKGKDEILRLRAAVAELEAEKEELRQRIANKAKADRDVEEAEADRKFRAKQQEFGDLLNSNSSASDKAQNYRIPRKQTSTAGKPLYRSGQSDQNHVSLVGTLSTPPAPHPGGAAAPAQSHPSPGTSAPSTFKSEESHRVTRLPPYCKKFLKGECSFGASCRFIHISEGERQRILASRKEDRPKEQLSLEDQVTEAVNRILADKSSRK